MDQFIPLVILIMGLILEVSLLLLAFHIATFLTKMKKRSLKMNILATVIFAAIIFAITSTTSSAEVDIMQAVHMPPLSIAMLVSFLLFKFLYKGTFKQALATTAIFTLLFIVALFIVYLCAGIIFITALNGIGEVRVY